VGGARAEIDFDALETLETHFDVALFVRLNWYIEKYFIALKRK